MAVEPIRGGETPQDMARKMAAVIDDLNRVPSVRGPLFTAVGTSFEDGAGRDIKPPLTTPSRAYMNDGWLTWFRILTHQRINLPVEYILGSSGARWNTPDTGIKAQLRAVRNLSPRPDYCIIGGEPNDIGDSRSYTDIKADWVEGVSYVIDLGITPVVCTTIPRGTNSLSATQLATLIRMNNFKREFCYLNRNVILLDPWRYMADQASASSSAISGMIKTSDNLHPATIGAFWWGKAATDIFNSMFPQRWTNFLTTADLYSADNPTGNLLFSGAANYGMMAGTGGPQTADGGLTHAGSTAAGVTNVRSGSSTCTWTHSKENPRTDDGRANGERQVEQIAATSGGDADEVYNTRITPTFANFNVGDLVYAQCSIEVSVAPVRVTALELYTLQTRPTNSYTAIDGSLNSSTAGFLPAVTWQGAMRTPPFEIQSDATAMQLNVRARLDTSAADANITYKIGDMMLRKVADTW